MSHKTKIEIFCGTGGVGKTTLATARAMQLASDLKNVLLITIDPAKRLKDLIGLEEENSNITSIAVLGSAAAKLDVLIASSEKIYARLSKKNSLPKSRILNLLMNPLGGMNEILCMVEINELMLQQKYDFIILDTAPGTHFIDFIDSSNKINSFFDKSFLEIFKMLSNKSEKGFFRRMISSSVEKLLSYLDKVTGESFVQEFIEAVSIIYKMKDVFLSSNSIVEKIKDIHYCRWFFVTSSDQDKIDEISSMLTHLSLLKNNPPIGVLNKDITALIKEDLKNENPKIVIDLLISAQTREEKLIRELNKHFKKIIVFEAHQESQLSDGLLRLIEKWRTYE